MMAYRSSLHDSTGYTHQFPVFGQELNLPLDFMYPNQQENAITDVHEFVLSKQQCFSTSF